MLVALGIVAVAAPRQGRRVLPLAALALVGASLCEGVAFAADPPPPFVDRLYRFGEGDAMVTAGQPVSQTDSQGNYVTFDTAGALGQNQLIDLIAVSPTSRRATYVSTADRPDGMGGIGLRLNELPFDRQYLRTGFGEALNFPEQSPSSSASLVNPGGTINYFRINDRGFELWAKPTAITGTHHIVMDSQQHGVLIDQTGKCCDAIRKSLYRGNRAASGPRRRTRHAGRHPERIRSGHYASGLSNGRYGPTKPVVSPFRGSAVRAWERLDFLYQRRC